MGIIRFAKVIASLPGTLVRDTFYAVRTGAGFDLYLSDATGSVAHPLNVGSGGGATIKTVDLDFGTLAVRSKVFTVVDASVTATSKIIIQQSGKSPAGRADDENELTVLHFRAVPANGSFKVYADCLNGTVKGQYRANYQVG